MNAVALTAVFDELLPNSEVVIFAPVDGSGWSELGSGLSIVTVTSGAEEVLHVVLEAWVVEEDDTRRICKLNALFIFGWICNMGSGIQYRYRGLGKGCPW
jgi:hypothetical protein